MPKGYKMPKAASPRATMRAGKAKEEKLLQPAPKLTSKVPEIRPSWKRNQRSVSSFKPGSY